MFRLSWLKLQDALFFLTLTFVILWRGGKGIEATWILAGLAGFLTLLSYRPRGEGHAQAATPAIPWLLGILFIAWTILSQIFSSVSNYGLDEVLRDGSLLLLLFWIVRHPNREKWQQTFQHVLSWAALVAGVIGIAVYIHQPVNRLVGTFFDFRFHTDYWPNAWAEFLLMALPALFFYLPKRSTQSRIVLSALTGFLVGTLILSYSRGAMLAFAGQIVLSAILFAGPIWEKRNEWITYILRTTPFALMIFCAAVVTFMFANSLRATTFDVQSMQEKVTFTAAEGKSSVSERSQFWRQARQLANERPLFGWGPYSFRFTQPPLMEGVLETSDHPHNMFLKAAAERGWPAAILLVGFIATVLFSSEKKSMRDPKMLWVTLGIAGVLAHNLIDYNLQFVAIALPFWVLFALSFDAKPIRPSLHTAMKCTEILLACALLFVAAYEGRFLVLSSLGRHAQAAGNKEEALQWYEQSRGEFFSRDLHLSRTELYLQSGNDRAALSALDDFMALNAEDPRAWKLQGIAFKMASDTNSSHRALTEAYSRGKFTDLTIVRLFLESSGPNTIGDRKQELEELFTMYEEAIERNTHFIALSGNVEELQLVAKLLDGIYPGSVPSHAERAAKTMEQAKDDRETYSSRPEGRFW